MIEENGGPEGLDLSYRDLSGIDLGGEQFWESELRQYVDRTTDPPVWLHRTDTWVGVNLRGANLQGVDFRGASLRVVNFDGARLRRANFAGADCWAASFRRAFLRRANFEKAYLSEADFQGAYVGRCTFTDADLGEADLRMANLNRSDLTNASCLNVSLDDANIRQAIFMNTKFGRDSLGNKLLFERTAEDLSQSISSEATLYGNETGYRCDTAFIPIRLAVARDIYRTLKNNFASLGQYEDASWAHIKERQLERMMKAPWRALSHYGRTHPVGIEKLTVYQLLPRWHPLRWWFSLKHTILWLLDWATELTCGYGERPLRTVALAGVILAVFPLIFWAIGGVGEQDLLLGRDIVSLDFFDYVIYSAGAFATIGYEELKPINTAAQVWTAMEALLGISILALMMFTLGNRISRS